jgi:phage N-6-adenine-methyltransferase
MSGLSRFKAKNHPQQVAKRPNSPRLFGPDVDPAEEVDDRGTPQSFFDEWDRNFRFTVDVAASVANAKCAKFYTAQDNGLEQDWDDEIVWCNPPYSNIEPWVRKALNSSCETVMLLPANRTEQSWWQDLVEPIRDRDDSRLRTQFIRGRLKFTNPGDEGAAANNRPPFGCVLLIFGAPVEGREEK